MLVRYLSPLVAAGLMLGCADPPAPEPERPVSRSTVEVMTFNIRYANPDDGADRWERRKELVFGVIRRHAPDLIGLQEALDGQMEELRAAFPDYRFLGQGREGGRSGEYSALMVRDDRFEIVSHDDFWLSPFPDEVGSRGWDAALPRMCTWAVLREREGERTFLAMNTHFDHQGPVARRESARLILELRAAHSELPLILTGDLNASEASPPLSELRAAGLRDSFRDVHPDALDVGTFNGFSGKSDGDKIDYVLVDGWATLAARIVRDSEGGRYPSDHYPVTATLVAAGLTIEQPTPITALLAAPEEHVGKAVRIDGVVTEICTRHGDWLKIAGPRSGSGILVRVGDSGISFPPDWLNRPVSVEGVIEPLPDELLEGESAPRVCSAMTRGGVRFHLRATGAALRRPGSHPRPL